jgi:hypothetical protein
MLEALRAQRWMFALPFGDFSGRFTERLQMRQCPGSYAPWTPLGS